MRIGVDTGGTFTDCVILTGGQVKILKVFSTPADASAVVPPDFKCKVDEQLNLVLERQACRFP